MGLIIGRERRRGGGDCRSQRLSNKNLFIVDLNLAHIISFRLPFGSPAFAVKTKAVNATKVEKEEKRSDGFWGTHPSHFKRLDHVCHGVRTGNWSGEPSQPRR